MQPLPLKALTDNYIWVIPESATSVFTCVDPGEAEPVLTFAKEKQWELQHILLTHHHFDHIAGVEELLDAFPQCILHSPSDPRIPQAKSFMPSSIIAGSHTYEILKTQGHTATHISYYAPKPGWLFCGDTLFSAGCGRVFDGTMEALYQSLDLYKNLPDSTMVFCAHEYTRKNLSFAREVEPLNPDIQQYIQIIDKNPKSCSLPSLIGLEKKVNPFLRTNIPEVQDFALKHGARSRDSLEVFRVLREEKDRF